MRKFPIILVCILLSSALFAGDIANFNNLGFSQDGNRFVFAQYGVTDAEFYGFADIYCVDVAKNDFIPGGVFSVAPSRNTAGKDGLSLFTDLKNSSARYFLQLGVEQSRQGRSIYVLSENGSSVSTINFRDYETERDYSIRLNALAEGTGKNLSSSFYINLEITDKDGKTQKRTVGLPGFKRKGVSGYRIRRIITDDSGKSLVFVIEKEMPAANGTSVRYMVETLKL